jgi:HK97 family phage portal protein
MQFDLTRALGNQLEGKAIPAHPALLDRNPVSIYSPGKSREDAVISQREATRHGEAYGGAQAIDWVYDCIGLYSDACSTAPWHLEEKDGTKLVRKKTDYTPEEYKVGPAELYDLLDRPNPYMLYDEMVALLVIDLLLVGNAYWLKWRPNGAGQPIALYRLAPSHVKIKPGAYGPKRYEYQPPGQREPLKIAPESIVHFRRPNPHSGYYGMGIIQGAGRAMDLELAITDTMAAYYENRADPSLIVQSERRVPRDVFNKLRVQLRNRIGGSSKAGELLVLESGLKASTLSVNARDALFAELSKMSRDRVFTKFRASPMLFGMMDGASGGNKVADARREFDNYALRPFMDKVQRQVSAAIADLWDLNFVIDHRSILPAEEAIKVAESVAKMPGAKIREIRRQYEQFGIEESTGDREIDDLVINVPGEELDENGQNGLADQPLAGEAGRPPKVENTAAFGVANAKVREGKALSMEEIELRLQSIVAEGKAVTNAAGERVTVGNRLQGEQAPSDDFATARSADIDGVTAFIAAGLRDATVQLERDLLDHVEGKALKTSDIVSRIQRSPAWAAFKDRIEAVLKEGARRSAASGVMHSGLTPPEDVDYDEIANTIVHRPDGVKAIMATLKDRVVSKIKEARSGDAERGEYEEVVRSTIASWAESQAVTVADTEATHAYNEATLTAAELSGVDRVYVTDGDEHDMPCVEANGQVWTLEQARANRVEHPRCRRAFLPLNAVA